MQKVKPVFIDLLLLFIITAPAFIRILNNQFFTVHDDQHIVRLFLLDQGIKQGYAYPRWVDYLGFGFGYPLFNFYPPLIYYAADFFHWLGFSLIWSIKLLIIFGFYIGTIGIFILARKFIGRLGGYISSTLYTFFFYHAVLVYVRGALAEFIALSILPFVFLTFNSLFNKSNWTNSIFFGLSLALLILTQPLIAIPAVFFLFFFFLFYLWKSKEKSKFVLFTILSIFIGLSLSSFFWLPSMVERKFTLVDKILTSELASYKLHFIYPQQFLYSQWAYGGSGQGLADGMTFQLGKIHLSLVVLSLVMSFLYFFKKKKFDSVLNFYLLFLSLFLFSLFMTTEYSSVIWDRVKYLWYLQFPWRFLTFTALFISILGGYFIFYLDKIAQQRFREKNMIYRYILFFIGAAIIVSTILIYQKYFRPERFISTTDKERTSFEEIAWRTSRTSYEFVPKGVKTKKSDLNTTILAIEKKDLAKKPYEIISGEGEVRILENRFQNKTFFVEAKNPMIFRLNTYNFSGWSAYLNNNAVSINDKNDFRRVTIIIPSGKYKVNFIFEGTFIRKIASYLSLATFVGVVGLLLSNQFKKKDG